MNLERHRPNESVNHGFLPSAASSRSFWMRSAGLA
jgi:hypothetical protein